MVEAATSDSDSSATPTENTMKRHRSPHPPPPPEASSRPATSRQAEMLVPEATRQHQTRDDTIRILVLGRSGSGKTRIIQTLHDGAERPLAGGSFEATINPYSKVVLLAGRRFELIDTPGFDNINLSDTEVFTKIADYLLESDRIDAGITKIIYVHRVGDVIQSRSLSRNLQVLTDIFLQGIGPSRVMILETQLGVQRTPHLTLIDEIRDQPSAFDRLGALGAQLSRYFDRRGFIDILRTCVSQTPIMLPIQLDGFRGSRSDFTTRVERTLGYYEQESMETILQSQEHDLRETYEAKLTRQREAESQLQQHLKEAELGYSSLRSQLQLQENVEQSEVVQALNDLNRMIDDIGRSISAYLTDTHVSSILGIDPSDATTLDAADLPALKTLLYHVDGGSSTIMSSGGEGMHIESFFDFAIRHMICRYLTRTIFRPFHPGIRSSLSEALIATYENIQRQAPQVIAGKWRSETFKNIYDDQGKHKQLIKAHHEKLMNDRLRPLARCVFGQDIPFSDGHTNRLYLLMKMAWDWNSKLKTDVIMLGDFVQTSFSVRSRFNPTLVEEFEPNPHNPEPLLTLSTLALGLLTRRAVGGGEPVEETVISKAIVLTSNVFV